MPDRLRKTADTTEDAFADRDVEVGHDLASCVAELRRLADSLERGVAFTIAVDGEGIAVPPHARQSVAPEREEGDVALAFQLIWSEVEEEDDEAAGAGDAMPKIAAA